MAGDIEFPDISGYVNEQYIFLEATNFDKFGNGTAAAGIFNKRYLQERERIGTMKETDIAANKKLAYIVGEQDTIESTLELYKQTAQGELLELCLEDVAAGINNAISRISSGSKIQTTVETAYSLANLFSSGREKLEKAKLDKFFNLISDGLKEMQGGVSPKFVKELSRLSEKFLYGSSNLPIIEGEKLTKAEQLVRKYLEKAANKLNAEEKIDEESLRGSISNIFNTAICEKLGQNLLTQGVETGLSDIIKALKDHTFKNSNVKVVGVMYANTAVDEGLGQKKTISEHTSKVDLTGPGPLEIVLQAGDNVIMIEMGLNASAKQVLTAGTGRNPSRLKGGVHIVTTNIGKLFNNTKFSPIESYYGYNTIVHRDSEKSAYGSFRKAVAASFFVEWLIGTGEPIKDSPVIDTAQFFLINNKLYSMSTVIRSICKRIVDDKKNPPIVIEIRNKKVNDKVTEVSQANNKADAITRSNAVRKAINTIAVGATLNKGIINQYMT